MAVTTKIVRVANPKRGRGKFRLRTARRKNAKKRLTPKQIRHFGTKAQKAALKRKYRARFTKSKSTGATGGRKRRRAKNGSRRAASRVKVVYRYRKANPKRRTRRRRSNPALVVTLGSINPKRRKSVAKSRKRRTRWATNTRRRNSHRTTRRRRNTRRTRVVVVSAPRRRRRHNGSSTRRRRHIRRRRHSSGSRRNPFMGGGSGMLKAGAGILLGVTAAKLLPKAVPASVASSVGSGTIMAIGISAASAWITGWALKKFVDPTLGEYAMYGGIAQTISVALNAFLPSVGGTFSLGDLVNGSFVVPQNPIRAGMGGGAMSAPASRGMAAYGAAY